MSCACTEVGAHVGAAGAQGTVVSFSVMTASATAMQLPGFAGELQTMLPLVIFQCQGSLRTLEVVGIWGRDVSGLIQRTTSFKSSYERVVSAGSLSQAA